jgi:hypothetical protein
MFGITHLDDKTIRVFADFRSGQWDQANEAAKRADRANEKGAVILTKSQAGNSVLIPFNENQAELILNAFAFFIVSGVAPAALSDEQKDLINKMLDNFPSLKEKYGFIWP